MNDSDGGRLVEFAAHLSTRASQGRAAACPKARQAAEELARWAGLLRGAIGLRLELRDLLAVAHVRRSELTVEAPASEPAPSHAVVEEVIAFLQAIVHPE